MVQTMPNENRKHTHTHTHVELTRRQRAKKYRQMVKSHIDCVTKMLETQSISCTNMENEHNLVGLTHNSLE